MMMMMMIIIIVIIIYLNANGLSPGDSGHYACTKIKNKAIYLVISS